jgi:hypothetical protein
MAGRSFLLRIPAAAGKRVAASHAGLAKDFTSGHKIKRLGLC